MTKEEIIKHLHEALNSVDITFPYRYVFVEAIEALSQPSTPSNLDEAANKFAVFYDQGTCDGIVQDCFKAGAEWMAGQGETRDDIVVTEDFDNKAHIFPIPSSEFNPGDRVIVQIRKK